MENKIIVNLKNIKYNALAIKKMLPSGVKFCAVVKADAYGHGSVKVSNILYPLVDYFAVATIKEAIELRLSGIEKDILVFTRPFKENIVDAIKYNLTITISSIYQLTLAQKLAKLYKKTIKVHLELDTGMNRQGFTSIKALKNAIDILPKMPNVYLDGMYSHYSYPENDKAYNKQTSIFLVANKMIKSYNKNAVCHISASGGFLRGAFFDMVRIGILLYGYYPYNTNKIVVKPAMKVISPVLVSKRLGFNQNALYKNKKNVIPKNVHLIRYGYADGLNRKEINGQFNNRCMDVSLIIDKRKKLRSYCVMANAETLAKKYHTISYEILVKCGKRGQVKYIY